ncbi:MAG: phosphoribosylformylglycinamidine synthase subunit PurQ [Rhodospirillales bacterium]|nr:MAG: phosphoribosylformylglycinamidine synthase subunit PurQ [Rhodospirillales bacterium]
MQTAVIVFPGSNCDRDVAVALTQATGRAPLMLWHRETEMPPLDLIVIPGGFSYGDYLRAGAMAAHSPVIREVTARAAHGVPILGICNGFQVLCEAGMLPGVLMRNAGLRFLCRDVWLRVDNTETAFTRGYRPGQVVRMPIAHNDGNYFADPATLDRLEADGRIAFRYCDAAGTVDEADNPNGSVRSIAGIVDDRGTVLGMMPHPERAADARLGGTDGRILFQSLLTVLA